MKHITACFSKDLINICQHSFQSEKWQVSIEAYLGTPLNKHICLAQFKAGKMTLIADCPLWASEMRMRLPDLRDYLRKELKCHQLKFIEIKTEPSFYKK